MPPPQSSRHQTLCAPMVVVGGTVMGEKSTTLSQLQCHAIYPSIFYTIAKYLSLLFISQSIFSTIYLCICFICTSLLDWRKVYI